MTLQKIEFEYDIPDGYRFVRFGKVINGREYLNRDGDVLMWTFSFSSSYDFIIVEKIPEQPKRKHADLIHAWADGAEIQVYNGSIWIDTNVPSFINENQYRIKPKTKTVRFRNYIDHTGNICVTQDRYTDFKWLGDWQEVQI